MFSCATSVRPIPVIVLILAWLLATLLLFSRDVLICASIMTVFCLFNVLRPIHIVMLSVLLVAAVSTLLVSLINLCLVPGMALIILALVVTIVLALMALWSRGILHLLMLSLSTIVRHGIV